MWQKKENAKRREKRLASRRARLLPSASAELREARARNAELEQERDAARKDSAIWRKEALRLRMECKKGYWNRFVVWDQHRECLEGAREIHAQSLKSPAERTVR